MNSESIFDATGEQLAGDYETPGSKYAQTLLVTYEGDLNLDGYVDEAEALTVIGNVGTLNSTWEQGDANNDGEVAPGDANESVSNEGKGVVSGEGIVPEQMWGDDGDDRLVFLSPRGQEDISVYGGQGIDTVDFSDLAFGISFDLAESTPTLSDPFQESDKDKIVLVSDLTIENILGTDHSDYLFGDEQNNRIESLGGNDLLFGYGGQDVLLAGDGDDQLIGGDGSDSLSGGDGDDDYLYTMDLAGHTGYDSIVEFPGGGDDDIDFSGFSSVDQGLIFDLGSPNSQIALTHASGAYLGYTALAGQEIERVIGTTQDDLIAGNEFDNTILGGAGHDIIFGRGGDDTLDGEDRRNWNWRQFVLI